MIILRFHNEITTSYALQRITMTSKDFVGPTMTSLDLLAPNVIITSTLEFYLDLYSDSLRSS